MEFDLKKSYCYFFNEICKIPHGSKNERALSDWIMAFARERGFSCVQDQQWNVVVYKPASPGYESHPGVIIQAHMDMVCERTEECLHDFEKEPLDLYVEGEHLRARGTTLGADDGMGCAYMLALLAEDEMPHPFLECCFTTQEETGLQGAQALKPEYFKARRLINLDGAGEYKTYMSMAGGEQITLKMPVVKEEIQGKAYRLVVRGLQGGAANSMIDKERANAGKLAARVLCSLERKGIVLRLADFKGGTRRNVILSEAEAVFVSDASEELLQSVVQRCQKEIFDEFEYSDPGILIELLSVEKTEKALREQDSQNLLHLLYLLPQGLVSRNIKVEGLPPVTSLNLGTIRLEAGEAVIEMSARSALESAIKELENQLSMLGGLFGARMECSGGYPGWKYEEGSELREIMKQVFFQLYGKPLNCLIGHGGNECGVFKKMFPEMDIVTSGAIYGNIHTPEEFLDLASFDRAWVLLTRLLAAL